MPYNPNSANNLKSWRQGESGNPIGSSKLSKAKAELQSLADERWHEPIGLFLDMMNNDSLRFELRLKAASLADERMNGRPRQALDIRDERGIEELLGELPDPD